MKRILMVSLLLIGFTFWGCNDDHGGSGVWPGDYFTPNNISIRSNKKLSLNLFRFSLIFSGEEFYTKTTTNTVGGATALTLLSPGHLGSRQRVRELNFITLEPFDSTTPKTTNFNDKIFVTSSWDKLRVDTTTFTDFNIGREGVFTDSRDLEANFGLVSHPLNVLHFKVEAILDNGDTLYTESEPITF